MSTPALTYHTITLELRQCKDCGVSFGLSSQFVETRRDDHRTWYCPNGHGWCYKAESDIERERQRRISAEARAAQAEDRVDILKRQRAAAKGQLTKLRNRIANGVCPWCKRSFSNILAHIDTQHPDHAEEARKAAS